MTTTTDPGTAGKGLKPGALTFLSSVVIGVASTAPAYSLAATIGLVVVAVGAQAPAVMIAAFLPMYCIAVAYQQLNKAEPDCGTTFRWAGRAFGPRAGWLGGWGMLAAFVIVMSSLAQVAGAYGFELVGANGLAASTTWTTVAGIVWIVAMTAICYIGIELAARVQRALLVLELVTLALLAGTAVVRVLTGHAGSGAAHPALSWFNPFQVHDFGGLSRGVLLAAFIYWGWDTTLAVNEETQDRTRAPGRAAVISVLVLLATYAAVTTAIQAYAGTGSTGLGLANPDHATDVLSVLGTGVFGGSGIGWFLAKLLVLMVLTSAAASTQTTVLPASRAMLSMAVHDALPPRFARVHARYLTPAYATVVFGAVSIGFYLVMTLVSTNVLADTVSSLGLMIAFYYGLTGFSCVWYYRRVLGRSAGDLWLKGVLPFFGGLSLLTFFVKSCVDYIAPDAGSTSWTVPGLHWRLGGIFLTGIGTLLLGVLLMLLQTRLRPAFFRGATLAGPVAVSEAERAEQPDGVGHEEEPVAGQ